MVQFFVKRFIGLVFILIGVSFITFIMGYFAPGDPITLLLGQHFTLPEEAALKHVYGLDLPWYQQYFNYVTGVLQGNLGLSFEFKNQGVWDILSRGVPVSLELGFWALLLQVVIGVPLGIISALKANTWIDTTNMSAMLVIYAIPSFVLAVIAQFIILQLDHATGFYWPVSGWGNAWQYTPTDLEYKLAPILVYAAIGLAYFARLTRTTMLEVLRQDYVRTARAKGMAERIVIYKHAFRNALIPLVTVIGLLLGFLVTGAFFIEQIFNIPGIAQITLNSIQNSDYPVIQATTLLLAIAVVFGNLLSDILYSIVDPRIKVS